MAIGNQNATGSSKKVESPFKGFTNYNLQVFTKDGENVFKIERSFIMNPPKEEMFDSEDEFKKAEAEHSKLMAKYRKHVEKCQLNPTDKDSSYYIRQYERNMRLLSEGGDKVIYASYPADTPTSNMIDGVIFNMSQKLDVISDKQKTEKVYFDLVDFKNKEIYRVNSSFSTATRGWLDSMLRIEDFKNPIQLKFEIEMDSQKDFKEPKLRDGKQIINAVLMNEFRDGYYRKKVKPLYYQYEKLKEGEKGKKGETHKHVCTEPDAQEYHDALQFAIKKSFNGDIIDFFVNKVNNVIIPRIQKSMIELFDEKGYSTEYMKNEKTSLFTAYFKRTNSLPSEEELVSNEVSAPTKFNEEELPF